MEMGQLVIEAAEVDTLLNVLRAELRDATTGLYAEKKWARSVEVLILILEEWRQSRQSPTANASDLDGPVWSASQMNGSTALKAATTNATIS